MAHSKQALKRNRQNQKARVKNRAQRSSMRTAIEKVRAVTGSEGSTGDKKKDLALAVQSVDKAAKRRVIHPNAAARIKSRMAKALAKAK